MRNFLSLVGVFVLVISCPTFGAIVYSGSQNVTLSLEGGTDPPPAMHIISIAGDPGDWDDFIITLEYQGPMTMAMGTTLTIGGMGMGMVVANNDPMAPQVFNLARDALISDASPVAESALLLSFINGNADGEFDESGGYIGLVLPGSSYYGWLHMLSMSDIGLSTQSVTFDGWAYEDEVGVPIRAGDIPEPSILLLCSMGGLIAWVRRRRSL